MRHLTSEAHIERLEIWHRMSAQGATWLAMSQAAGVHTTTFREWASKHAPGAHAYLDKRQYHLKTVAGRIESGLERGWDTWRVARAVRMTVEELRAFCAISGIDLPAPKVAKPKPQPNAKYTPPPPSKALTMDQSEFRARVWHRGRLRGDSWRVMAQEVGISITAFQEWVARNVPEDERERAPVNPRKDAPPPTTERKCLGCRDVFASEGAHHRMCGPCARRVSSPYEPEFGRANARRAASHRA